MATRDFDGETILSQALDAAKASGATAADALLAEAQSVDVTWRLGAQERLERSESVGLGLRVFVGKKPATVSTTDLSKDAIQQAAARAVTMARLAPDDPYVQLAKPEQFSDTRTAVGLDLLDAEEPSPEWLIEQAKACEEAGRAIQGISNSEGADTSYSARRHWLATSEGFSGETATSLFATSLSVIAKGNEGMERDYAYHMTRHRNALKSPEAIGKEAAERTLKRLNPQKLSTMQCPVIFDPRVGRSLLGSFAGAISGTAIARGTSFLKESMGEPLFAKGVSIIDDPLRVGGLASRPFDGEGVASQPLALVKDGTLQHWLLDLATAAQLDLETNGRASRGLASPPHPSATNLYMEAGSQTPAELMANIERGIYITETFGMGINTVTGDYSQGASGFLIEKGEITGPVSEITIAGHMKEMFASLTPANDLAFDYATNTPTFRIERMTIAGS